MTTLILTAATLWLVVIPSAIALLLRHDRSQDEAWEAERPERPALPQRVPEFGAHPSVGRIVDRIVANEAARIAEEWEAMNR